jgi:hypothetical protein
MASVVGEYDGTAKLLLNAAVTHGSCFTLGCSGMFVNCANMHSTISLATGLNF